MTEIIHKKYRQYWRRNVRLTAWLLGLWLFLTIGVTLFVDELNALRFMGFPLGYFMTAQGVLVLYLAIVWFSARRMNRADADFETDLED